MIDEENSDLGYGTDGIVGPVARAAAFAASSAASIRGDVIRGVGPGGAAMAGEAVWGARRRGAPARRSRPRLRRTSCCARQAACTQGWGEAGSNPVTNGRHAPPHTYTHAVFKRLNSYILSWVNHQSKHVYLPQLIRLKLRIYKYIRM